MRLLALILSVAVLAAAGAREASAGTAPAPCGGSLSATTIDDHVPAPWHIEHRRGR